MYLVVVVVGLYFATLPLFVSIPLILLIGLVFGAVNAWFIDLPEDRLPSSSRWRPCSSGAASHSTSPRRRWSFQSDVVQTLGRSSALGVPWAIWILAAVALVAWVVLDSDTFGRQVYAVGSDPDAAAKAGIRVRPIVFSVFCICSVCAAIGALISV